MVVVTALIDTDVAHAFDCDGQLTAIGWIEGESRLAGQLRDRVLEGRPYAVLDEPLCDHLADGLGPAFGKTTGCPEAYKRWRDALGWLAIDELPLTTATSPAGFPGSGLLAPADGAACNQAGSPQAFRCQFLYRLSAASYARFL